MPCYVCNPQCGRCRPPRPAPVKCPECGRLVFGGGICCTYCGACLPIQPSVFCEFAKRVCFVPCVRANETNSDGSENKCPWGERFGAEPIEKGSR